MSSKEIFRHGSFTWFSVVLIEIDGDLIGNRIALAGQYETARDFVVLERIVRIHIHFAFDELGTAGGAHAAFARMPYVDSTAQRGIQNAFGVLLHGKCMLRSIKHQSYFALRFT